MPVLIILTGAPGSGKTTLSKKLAEEHNLTRISMDESGYLQNWELTAPIIECLQSDKSVIVDTVYARKTCRAELISAVSHIPCRKIALFMDTQKEECLRRNSGRVNPLPDFMVESIFDTMESPTYSEGWDDIYIVS